MCPCDGKVLHFGRVDDGQLEQVKGVTYNLVKFLGPHNTVPSDGTQNKSKEDTDQDTDLFHVILYLAPGDYHHFHSPADWTVTKRRHFPGSTVKLF